MGVRTIFGSLLAVLVLMPLSAAAQDAQFALGGDYYGAGSSAKVVEPVTNDAWLAGYDAVISAPVGHDAHLAGFTANVSANVGGDVYAAGNSVTVAGVVGGDVTAMGQTVTLGTTSSVAGNARLAAETVTIGGPVSGAALVGSRKLALNSTVGGDLVFGGESIDFGPTAKVTGILTIWSQSDITVPPEVASPDRVIFHKVTPRDPVPNPAVPSVSPGIWGIVGWWVFLFVVGAVVIGLMPKGRDALELASEARPFHRLGLGLLAFAATIGLVPLTAMTLIGLVVTPFAVLYAAIAIILAYVGGAYLVTRRVVLGFMKASGNGARLAVLALAVVAAGLLAMVPILGWLITLLLTTYGFGAASAVILSRWEARRVAPPVVAAG